MSRDIAYIKRWVLLGIICGLAMSLLYAATFFIQNLILAVIVVAALGPSLSIASVGLYHFLNIDQKRISSQIAAVANIIGGTLLTTMLMVQLSINASKPEATDVSGNWAWTTFHHIHYGLDVAWDIFLFVGIFCYALSMLSHPKFGRVFAISGLVISVIFIAFNVWTFPVPPASAEMYDLGPLVGLWFLAVTVRVITLYRGIGRN